MVPASACPPPELISDETGGLDPTAGPGHCLPHRVLDDLLLQHRQPARQGAADAVERDQERQRRRRPHAWCRAVEATRRNHLRPGTGTARRTMPTSGLEPDTRPPAASAATAPDPPPPPVGVAAVESRPGPRPSDLLGDQRPRHAPTRCGHGTPARHTGRPAALCPAPRQHQRRRRGQRGTAHSPRCPPARFRDACARHGIRAASSGVFHSRSRCRTPLASPRRRATPTPVEMLPIAGRSYRSEPSVRRPESSPTHLCRDTWLACSRYCFGQRTRHPHGPRPRPPRRGERVFHTLPLQLPPQHAQPLAEPGLDLPSGQPCRSAISWKVSPWYSFRMIRVVLESAAIARSTNRPMSRLDSNT